MKRNKIGFSLLCILFVLYTVLLVVNPNDRYYIKVQNFNVDCTTITISDHITACGQNADKLETYYKALRKLFDANGINNKIRVYATKPFGSMLLYKGKYTNYLGIFYPSQTFRHDTIVYNGNDLVFIHELAHFFYHHLPDSKRDELFAQAIENLAKCYIVEQN